MGQTGKVIFITGASSGIGNVCSTHLQKLGHTVYGGSRTMDTAGANGFKAVRLDVRNDASVDDCVGEIFRREGRLDVVINCAGIGIAGAIEDTRVEEAQAQFETNFFGVHRVCRAVLPIMRSQKSGLVVNISSLAGLLAIPFQAFYTASKFALEGFTEALRMEVLPFGIRVVLIEPGDFKTQFPANRSKTAGSLSNAVYQQPLQRSLGVMEKEERNAREPLPVAKLVARIIENPSPRLRYTIGPFAERLSPKLKAVLPYRIYEKLFMKYYNLG
jgi:NAD(P)-dependent dehydrogenase (short-subunit alcohol dehydrogenase family)